MGLFRFVWHLFQLLVIMGVFVLSLEYYDPEFIVYEIPPLIKDMVMIGVVWVSLFWTVVHLVGGGLLGLAASGVGDGVKMGFLLGLGMGISRVWPHCAAWGAGNIVGEGPFWHAGVLLVLSAVLFVLNKLMHYFWGSIQNGLMREGE